VSVSESSDPERLVFVDEMGANTSLSVLRAWSRRGERAHCSVPRNRGKNTTLLASMSVEGMGPSLAVEGVTDRKVFEAYVEGVLAASLRRGQIVVMDNLSAHKGERIKELIEERGCELLYLPPYSPDLKWDEKVDTTLRMEPTMVSVGES
jgi:hypothetical protein